MNKSESKYFNTAKRMDEAFLALLNEKDFEYITVKEICEKANVNRSTFYLHYENIGDLLKESLEYMNYQFMSYFPENELLLINKISETNLQELYFITPRYLTPYLQYIKEHKRLFQTSIRKNIIFETDKRFNLLFQHIFNPIMERFNIPEEKKLYLITFYIEGIIGIIKKWLSNDCKEPIDFIIDIITEYVEKPKENYQK